MEEQPWIVSRRSLSTPKTLQHPLQGNDKGVFEEACGNSAPQLMAEIEMYNFSNLMCLTFSPCQGNTFLSQSVVVFGANKCYLWNLQLGQSKSQQIFISCSMIKVSVLSPEMHILCLETENAFYSQIMNAAIQNTLKQRLQLLTSAFYNAQEIQSYPF